MMKGDIYIRGAITSSAVAIPPSVQTITGSLEIADTSNIIYSSLLLDRYHPWTGNFQFDCVECHFMAANINLYQRMTC